MKELQRYKPVLGSHYVSGCGPEGDYEPYVYMYPDPNGEYVKLADVRKAEVPNPVGSYLHPRRQGIQPVGNDEA